MAHNEDKTEAHGDDLAGLLVSHPEHGACIVVTELDDGTTVVLPIAHLPGQVSVYTAELDVVTHTVT